MKIWLSAMAMLLATFSFSQTFYSQSSGSFDVTTRWNTAPGGGGTDAENTHFTDGASNFIIQAGHSIGQPSAGISIGDLTIDASGLFDPFGQSIQINGQTQISGTFRDTSSGGTNVFVGLFHVNIGGLMSSTFGTHEYRGGVANSGTFDAGLSSIHNFTTNAQSVTATSDIDMRGQVNFVSNVIFEETSSEVSVGSGSSTIVAGSSTVTNRIVTGFLRIESNSFDVAVGGSFINDINANLSINASSQDISGTFSATASGNTVEFDRVADQDVISGTYHHLTLTDQGAASQFARNVGANLTIQGDLNMSGISLDAPVEIRLAGNASGSSASAVSNSPTHFYFDGSSAQTFDLGTTNLQVQELTSTNPAGVDIQSDFEVTTSGVNVSAPITVTGAILNVTGGNITLDDVLTIDAAQLQKTNIGGFNSSTSFGSTRMVATENGGSVRINLPTSGGSNGLPLGTGSVYNPTTISATFTPAAGHFIDVSVNASEEINVYAPGRALTKHWAISSNAMTNISGSVSMTYDDTEIVGNESLYIPAYYDGSSWTTGVVGDVNESSNLVTYSFSGVSSLDGSYTAGEADAFDPFLVSNTNDSGTGSLRWALANANASASQETVSFGILGGAPWEIVTTSTITLSGNANGVIIDGLSQPGSSLWGDMVQINGPDGFTGATLLLSEPNVEIYGLHFTDGRYWIQANASGDNFQIGSDTEGNLFQSSNQYGFYIVDADGGSIQGNRIGTSKTGLNTTGTGTASHGIYLEDASNITIGGDLFVGQGNIISGNGSGSVYAINVFRSSDVAVQGNLIGTDINGANDLGNARGINASSTTPNLTIGGSSPSLQNVISGNDGSAITIQGTTDNLLIQNNIIGLSQDGVSRIPNTQGITITTGGVDRDIMDNTISGNTTTGIYLDQFTSNLNIQNNMIGTNPSGSAGGGLGNNDAGISIRSAAGVNSGDKLHIVDNVISGNGTGGSADYGIYISKSGQDPNNILIQRNNIGVESNGTTAYGNNLGGIGLHSTLTDLSGVTVGGSGNENVIAHNTTDGIYFLGTGVEVPNLELELNSYFCNGDVAIDFQDPGGPAVPVIASVSSSVISGTSGSTSGTVQVFTIDPSCADNQGETFVETASINGDGTWSISTGGYDDAATYTAYVDDASNGISEFGAAFMNQPFITTWQATGGQITIPTNAGETYTSYDVVWTNLTNPGVMEGSATVNVATDYTVTGMEDGSTYQVEISGTFPAIQFANTAAFRDKILTVEQWGDISWTSFSNAFYGCSNLTITASDAPDLSLVTDMSSAFHNASMLNQSIDHWDVSNVEDFSNMFRGASIFNQPLDSWTVTSALDMSQMFRNADAFNQNLNSWVPSSVSTMFGMFYGADVFDGAIGNWDVSSVTNMRSMFFLASDFNQPLAGWGTTTGLVQDMSLMFSNATSFDQPLNAWDVSSVQDMDNMFDNAAVFNQDLNGWITSSLNSLSQTFKDAVLFNGQIDQWDVDMVTTFHAMFDGASAFNRPLNNWTVTGALNMQNMFRDADAFNQDLNLWTPTSVTTMFGMFSNCLIFNGNITTWDVTSVDDMGNMFFLAPAFNQPIGSWGTTTGGVMDMGGMFWDATSFDQDISAWDVSSVTTMHNMFDGATAFNQDISGWTTSSIQSLSNAFRGASAFDQNLGGWDLTNVTTLVAMLNNSGMSVTNYDATLVGWEAQNPPTGLTLGATGLHYCSAAAEHTELQNPATHNWSITDAGQECAFITTWSNTGGTITIPITGTGYNYDISWTNLTTAMLGDGSATGVGDTPLVISGLHNTDTYRIEITGDFPRIYFNAGTERLKIRTVEQWGDIVWSSMANAFLSCDFLTITASDAPDLSSVTDMTSMFQSCPALTAENFNNWDVSNVQNMTQVFAFSQNFNGSVDMWDVSNVTTMLGMFWDARTFNQDLNSWTPTAVTDISRMFQTALSFNGNIDGWNMPNLTTAVETFYQAYALNQSLNGWTFGMLDNMSGMFRDAIIFNGNISSWDVSTVTDMTNLFSSALVFNQNISAWETGNVTTLEGTFAGSAFNQSLTTVGNAWDVSNVTNFTNTFTGATSFNRDLNWTIHTAGPVTMEGMFNGASSFNGNISAWDVSEVTDMSNMFMSAAAFTGDISGWQVGNVTEMNSMFQNATLFNTNIGSWTTSSVNTMTRMFQNATDFDQNLAWDVSNVTNMEWMFSGATDFNGDISSWTLTSLDRMSYMFENATSFNSDITGWDVTEVDFMQGTFSGATSFNRDISGWIITGVSIIQEMFAGATSFNQNISGWDVSNVTTMFATFSGASSFDQNLGSWDIGNVTNMAFMLSNSGLSTGNYDATLTGWADDNSGTETIPSGITLDAIGLTYCTAQTAKDLLEGATYTWTINDAGLDCSTAFIVTNTNDSGVGSLRWAIENANNIAGTENITFNIPNSDPNYSMDAGNGTEQWTIQPITNLSGFTEPAVLDATTQPGVGNYKVKIDGQGTLTIGLSIGGTGSTEIYGFEITGFNANSSSAGVNIFLTTNPSIIGDVGKGNVINGNRNGIYLLQGAGDIIKGNLIGTDTSGTAPVANGSGIAILTGSSSTIVGGTLAGEGNLISGNTNSGIATNASGGSQIVGNYIGTSLDGNSAIPNGSGISLGVGSGNSLINNIISGNTNAGIFMNQNTGTTVQGNKIGVAANDSALPNDYGINTLGGASNSSGHVIGGTGAGEANEIANNTTAGISLNSANDDNNQIIGNSIYCNGSGIDLNGVGNNNIQPPVITGASASSVSGTGTDGDVIHVYRDNSACDPAQGQEYLGTATVGSSVSGEWDANSLSSAITVGIDVITVTATNGTDGTSEFMEQDPFIVTNTLDTGLGSLRWCVSNANTTAGSNTITFSNSIDGGAITLNSEIILLTGNGDATIIDGDIDGDDVPNITIQSDGTNHSGFEILGANNQILDLNFQGFVGTGTGAIYIHDGAAMGNQVLGNHIGTILTGTSAGTSNFNGILIEDATDNVIGDGTAIGRNIIGNNTFGVRLIGAADTDIFGNTIGLANDGVTPLGNTGRGIDASSSDRLEIGIAGGEVTVVSESNGEGILIDGSEDATVVNSYIGTDITGLIDRGNADGLVINDGSNSAVIGGNTVADRNVISGNGSFGIEVNGSSSVSILGNYIGLGSDGNTAIGNDLSGVDIDDSDVTVGNELGGRNVISSNGQNGIHVVGDDASIFGNYIGTDANGNLDRGNTLSGVLDGGTSALQIGAAVAGRGNVISGNGTGISVSDDVSILGNYIGTNAAGDGAIPNNDGIRVSGSSNIIGNGTALGANVVSGNNNDGIYLRAAAGSIANNVIQGNIIGFEANGTSGLGNGDNGIFLGQSANNNSVIGNSIGFNTSDGVEIGEVGASGVDNNTVSQNLIHRNVGLGILHVNGANGGITPPTISTATATTISGTGTNGHTIELFIDNSSVTAQGETYEGSAVVAGGTWSVGGSFTPSETFTATATDATGNTSEFAVLAGTAPEISVFAGSDNSGIEVFTMGSHNIGAEAQGNNIVQTFAIENVGSTTLTINNITADQPEFIVNNSITSVAPGATETFTVTLLGTAIGSFSTTLSIDNDDPSESPFDLTVNGDIVDPYIVTNTLDNGLGSLRWAIENANASTSKETISFNIAETAPWEIELQTVLPTIDNPNDVGMIVDGTTQPGWTFGDPNAMVILDGATNAINNNGLTVQEPNVEIYGVVIDGFFRGIRYNAGSDDLIIGASGSGNIIKGCTGSGIISAGQIDNLVIQGNYVGLSIDGLSTDPNLVTGIHVDGDNALIGGNSLAGQGNVISGNGNSGLEYGISIESGDNVQIYGNLIGTDRNGENDLGNHRGIRVRAGVTNALIGGQGTGQSNVIAGTNSAYSVHLEHGIGTIVDSNLIGLNATGTLAIPNTGNGIDLTTTTGTGTIVQNNTIANSTGAGIYFDGLTQQPTGTTIGTNSYYCNGTEAIEFSLTPSVDVPIITSVTAGGVSGTTTAFDGSTVDVYQINAGCADNQGAVHIGQSAVFAGNWNYNSAVDAGQTYVATVTDVNDGISEFSLAVAGSVIPNDPSNLIVSEVSSTQIDLTWDDNSADETGFKIERSDGHNSSYAEIGTVGADVTAYSDNTVLADGRYFYRVRATNAGGDSGYSNEATGSTFTAPGNALDFDGVDDFVSFSAPNFTAYTIEAWVYLNTSNNFQSVIRYTPGGAGTSHHIVTDADGHFQHYTFDGNVRTVTSSTVASIGQWYHVAIVAENGGMARLYINGQEEGTPTAIGTLFTGGTQFIIGDQSVVGGATVTNYLDGRVDDLRIWDDVRSQTEIQSDMLNDLVGNEANLLGDYSFDQGIAGGDNTSPAINTLVDNSVNSVDGSLSGFDLNGSASNWLVSGARVLAAPGLTYYSTGVSNDFDDPTAWNSERDGSGSSPFASDFTDGMASFIVENGDDLTAAGGAIDINNFTIESGGSYYNGTEGFYVNGNTAIDGTLEFGVFANTEGAPTRFFGQLTIGSTGVFQRSGGGSNFYVYFYDDIVNEGTFNLNTNTQWRIAGDLTLTNNSTSDMRFADPNSGTGQINANLTILTGTNGQTIAMYGNGLIQVADGVLIANQSTYTDDNEAFIIQGLSAPTSASFENRVDAKLWYTPNNGLPSVNINFDFSHSDNLVGYIDNNNQDLIDTDHWHVGISNTVTNTLVADLNVLGDLRIHNSAVLNSGSNNINLTGNWTNDAGTSGFQPAGGTVVFEATGVDDQQLNGETLFDNLTINHTGTGLVDFNDQVNVFNTLSLTEGVLAVSAPLILEHSHVLNVTSPSDSRMVQVDPGGWLQLDFSDGIIAPVSNVTFDFPVGTVGEYSPVTLNLDAATVYDGGVTSFLQIIPVATEPTSPADLIQSGISLERHWSAAFANMSQVHGSMVLEYVDNDALSNGNEANYVPAYYDTQWNTYDGSAVDDTNNSVTFSFAGESSDNIGGVYTAGEAGAFLVVSPCPGIPTSECDALQEFHTATGGGTDWANNWFSSDPINDWAGITTDGSNVTEIVLDNLGLTGSIPNTIGDLTALTDVSLQDNQISGALPVSLNNMTLLEYIDLEGNQLTGAIPDLSSLSNLLTLDLSDNLLADPIPNSLWTMNGLRRLFLNGNNFTGSFPSDVISLTNLIELDLGDNEFTGSIPSNIGSTLTNLVSLDVSFNQLSGAIPTSVGNLVGLETLFLENNAFTGTVPDLTALFALETLELHDNQLEDLSDLSALTALSTLDVSNNRFHFDDLEPNATISGIVYSPQQSLDTPQDVEVAVGDAVNLTVPVGGNSNDYTWEKDGAQFSTSNELSIPIVSFSDGGAYQLSVTNANVPGLTLSTEAFNIEIIGDTKIHVYNVVTPNGDNKHDFLKIEKIEQHPGNRVTIFDRWGRKVYQGENYDNDVVRFEGRNTEGGGELLPSGTYFYVIIASNEKVTGYIQISSNQ